MNVFYIPDIKLDTQYLNDAESKHCIKVLRLRKGDTIHIVDGCGGFYSASIMDANPKRCQIKCFLVQKEFNKRNYYLHIALAPTKRMDRTEWFLEKCTEIGIDEFTPLLCERSERKTVKTERLCKVATSAMKQSVKAYHPRLNEMVSFKDFVKLDFNGMKFIAHCNKGEKTSLKKIYRENQNALILIGPEGDFSSDEVDLAKKHGFQEISLGSSRLRSETAGVVGCYAINLANEK